MKPKITQKISYLILLTHFSFAQEYLGEANDNSTYVTLCDIDNDNDLDALIEKYQHPNQLWLNDGTAFFTEFGPYFGENSQKIALGDLDLDGDLDVFIGNHEADHNRLYFNISSSTWINYNERPPSNILLKNIYPNPFILNTTICYHLQEKSHVVLEIFNQSGQKITTLLHENQSKGEHVIIWDGTNFSGCVVPKGIYYCSIQTGNISKSKEILKK